MDMCKEVFETEKKAEDFLKDALKNVVMESDIFSIIENLKSKGYIKESVIDKVEKEFLKYKSDISDRNFSKHIDMMAFIENDDKLIHFLYGAVQYLKNELTEIKKKNLFLSDTVQDLKNKLIEINKNNLFRYNDELTKIKKKNLSEKLA